GPGGGKVNVWDFTQAVKFWTDGKQANHGFMLHGDARDWMMRAHYRESSEGRNRPGVMVIYVPKGRRGVRFARNLSAAALLLAVGVISAGDADFVSRVDQRVQAWQPTKAERRMDEIGWVADIREALKLAKKHNRPVFLFTLDGRINIGRC